MSTMQTIIDQASQIDLKRKKVAGQSVTRSGRVLTGEIVSAVPFVIEVGMHNGLKYATNRALVEHIDNLDVVEEFTINIGNTNPGLAYITAYQGDLDANSIANITIVDYEAETFYIDSTNTTGSGNIFRAGDYIQPTATDYRYPYTVTQDVAYTANSNVSVPVHRNIIAQPNVTLANSNIRVGSDCEFTVKMRNKPTYSVVPGGRLEFSSSFELVEIIL